MARIRELSPGKWEITVATGRDPQTGRYGQASKTIRGPVGRGGKAPRAIRELAEEFAVEQRDAPTSRAGTVGEAVDAYIALRAARGAAPKTIDGYEQLAKRIRVSLGDVRVAKLTGADLDRFYSQLQLEGRAATTVHHYHALLRSVLRQGVKWGTIRYSPADRASPPSPRSGEMRPPEPEEIVRLVARARKENRHQLGRLVLFASLTGMRRGELCAIRWADVGDDSLVVRSSISDLPNRPIIERPTKTHKVRRIALDEMARAVLLEQLEETQGQCRACGVELTPDAFVWSQHPTHIEPWRPDRITDAFRFLAAREGIAVRFHDLRHFAATQLLGAGIDVRTVAGRLGHGADQTLGRYGHFIPAQDVRAAEALGRALAPAMPTATVPTLPIET
jgi:integrase